jgi:hypothetical protein
MYALLFAALQAALMFWKVLPAGHVWWIDAVLYAGFFAAAMNFRAGANVHIRLRHQVLLGALVRFGQRRGYEMFGALKQFEKGGYVGLIQAGESRAANTPRAARHLERAYPELRTSGEPEWRKAVIATRKVLEREQEVMKAFAVGMSLTIVGIYFLMR